MRRPAIATMLLLSVFVLAIELPPVILTLLKVGLVPNSFLYGHEFYAINHAIDALIESLVTKSSAIHGNVWGVSALLAVSGLLMQLWTFAIKRRLSGASGRVLNGAVAALSIVPIVAWIAEAYALSGQSPSSFVGDNLALYTATGVCVFVITFVCAAVWMMLSIAGMSNGRQQEEHHE